MFNLKHIIADLRKIGVKPGDVLMLHASLKAVGRVENGADGLLDALRLAVGKNGTLMMVLGAANKRPPGGTVFNPLTTPADPDVGRLAEILRTRTGCKVSNHPEGRFAALGPDAEFLLASQPWDDYFGLNSPLDHLCQCSGKILRLGADPDTITLTHFAEYLTPLSEKCRIIRQVLVQGREGPEQKEVCSLDDDEGIFEFDGEDYFVSILEAYMANKKGQSGKVGNAKSELLSAQGYASFASAWMAKHLG